jgi:hypothetical protein
MPKDKNFWIEARSEEKSIVDRYTFSQIYEFFPYKRGFHAEIKYENQLNVFARKNKMNAIYLLDL